MYVIRHKLKPKCNDITIIEKRFHLVSKIHNNLVSYAKKHLRMLKRDKDYRSALTAYHEAKNAENAIAKKTASDILNKRIEFYGLTKTALEKYVSVDQKKYTQHLSSQQCQAEAARVLKGVEAVLYSNGKDVHYKKYDDFNTICCKCPTNGIRLYDAIHTDFLPKSMEKPDFECIEWLGLIIPVEIDWKDPYVLAAMDNPDVAYCEIVRIPFNDGYHYYVDVYFRGTAPRKTKQKDIGVGVAGIDPGVSTVAVTTDDALFLEELAPRAKEYNKKIAKLQRQIDASTRATNPENYNEDGTCKKGKHKWVFSKSCLRRKQQLRVLYRKKSAYIKQSHRELINKLLAHADIYKVEKMTFKALQRRSKKTERQDKTSEVKNKKGEVKKVKKFKKKKRFGKSLNDRAPSEFLTLLQEKCAQYGLPYIEIKTSEFKASQYNHTTNKYDKCPLDQRSKDIGGHEVQRDLYSSFLIQHSNAAGTKPRRKDCVRDFDNFLYLHDNLIEKMKVDGKTMKQCFGF